MKQHRKNSIFHTSTSGSKAWYSTEIWSLEAENSRFPCFLVLATVELSQRCTSLNGKLTRNSRLPNVDLRVGST